MIGIVIAARRHFAATRLLGVNLSDDEIVFSLEKGEVLVSWRGSGPPLRLGTRNRVEAMMEDFLAQGRVGRRLTGKSD